MSIGFQSFFSTPLLEHTCFDGALHHQRSISKAVRNHKYGCAASPTSLCVYEMQTHQEATMKSFLHSATNGQKLHRVPLNVLCAGSNQKVYHLHNNNFSKNTSRHDVHCHALPNPNRSL